MDFAQRVKQLRKNKHLTGEQLGNILGITKTGISYWEMVEVFPIMKCY